MIARPAGSLWRSRKPSDRSPVAANSRWERTVERVRRPVPDIRCLSATDILPPSGMVLPGHNWGQVADTKSAATASSISATCPQPPVARRSVPRDAILAAMRPRRKPRSRDGSRARRQPLPQLPLPRRPEADTHHRDDHQPLPVSHEARAKVSRRFTSQVKNRCRRSFEDL